MGWGILGGETVEIQSGGVALQTHIGRPAAPGRYPAVIMLHGINGPSAGTRRAAERWGDEGYVGCLVNWQTADKDPADNEIMRFVADVADYLRQQEYVDADRIAISGYCRGGTLVYLALAHHSWLKAGIAFHGLPYKHLDSKKPHHPYELASHIQAPVLILHGAADKSAPVGEVFRMSERLESLGKTFEMTIYSGTGHAFTLPDGGAYNPVAAADAWREAVTFLDQHVKGV